jgi:hypothetical protein
MSDLDTKMTMRDYFAAKVLPWVLADIELDMNTGDTFHAAAAEFAYEIADAMMKARSK